MYSNIIRVISKAESFSELRNKLRENGIFLPNRWIHRLWQEELRDRREAAIPDYADAVQRAILHGTLTFNPDTGEILVR